MPKTSAKSKDRALKGWGKIAGFLGQTVSVAQRWHKSGEELTAWVGTERGQKEPVHIASEAEDLLGDLKQGLAYVRKQKKVRRC
jgi:hypothetical protein